MRRREFIARAVGFSAAATWPFDVRAQQPQRLRRIGALMAEAESTAESKARKESFEATLRQLGWRLGSTLSIDYRWAVNSPERAQIAARELVELHLDLIVAVATPAARAIKQATGTVPVVFVAVSEPMAQGFVASLARPGGNMTGFSYLEPTLGPKWLELLRDIAPDVSHAGILFNPDTAPFALPSARAAELAAPSLGMTAETIPIRGVEQIEAAISKIASTPRGGLIFPPDTHTATHVKDIVELSERHRLPAIHGLKFITALGGLAFYGVDVVDLFRGTAGYVDRILKGEKPADLPVQQPTKFELSINLKAAKIIGMAVPPTVLARADEVIE